MKKSELLGQLEHAYDRLQDALRISLEQELTIDGTIQHFEFTFELYPGRPQIAIFQWP